MHATEAAEGVHTSPNPRTRSVAAAAQLLELWVQGRCRLNQAEVEYYVHRLQVLDMGVADKYDALFVNVAVPPETEV